MRPIEIYLSVVPTTVSGTLSPFFIAFNGKPYANSAFSLSELQLNGVLIPSQDGQTHPFFTKTDADVLEFVLSTPDGIFRQMPAVLLPKLESAKAKGASIVFQVSGAVSKMLIDEKPVKLVGAIARWRVPKRDNVEGGSHVVELRGKTNKPGRLYNLRVGSQAPALVSGQDAPPPIQEAQGPAPASEPPAASSSSLHLASFRLNLLGILEGRSGEILSGELGWHPEYFFDDTWGLRANIDGAPLKRNGSGLFAALSYGLVATYRSHSWWEAELGGGLSSWLAFGGTRFVAQAAGAARLTPFSSLPFLDRFLLGYSALFDHGAIVHEPRLGIGLDF